MFERIQKQEYCIKTCPSDNTELLESTLNSMSKEGWELYTLHEVEVQDSFQYNCIFVRDYQKSEELDENLNYHSEMEKMLFHESEPYELCINLQKKIKEKRLNIQSIKSLLDKTDDREVLNEEITKNLNELNELKKQLNDLLVFGRDTSKLKCEKLSVELSEELGALISPDLDNNLISQGVKIRQELVNELGYIIPKIKFARESKLESYSFTISVHNVPVVSAYAYVGYVMFYEDELKAPKDAVKDTDVISGRKIFWLKKEKTKDFWAKGISASEYIANVLKAVCIKFVDEILDYTDVNRYVESVAHNDVFLIDNIIPDFLTISDLKYIIVKLIKERISVRDIVYIFEKINDFSTEENKENLYEKIRLSLSRRIAHSLADENGIIEAFELSPETIKQLEKSLGGDEDLIKIDFSKFDKMVGKIEKICANDSNIKVFLVPMYLREIFFAIVNQFLYNFTVICEEEVVAPYDVKIIDAV